MVYLRNIRDFQYAVPRIVAKYKIYETCKVTMYQVLQEKNHNTDDRGQFDVKKCYAPKLC